MKIKVLSTIELITLIDNLKGINPNSITNNQIRICDKAYKELSNRGAI